jgi:hypothetical protein
MQNNLKLRLGGSLWLLAMSGVVIVVLAMLPQLLAKVPQQVPLKVAMTASILQSGLMLALAVWAGISLSKPLGLGAPVIEAALTKSKVWPEVHRQLGPAAIVGLVVGAQLGLSRFVAPVEVMNAAQTVNIPLAAKIFYGGITEEVLMRWGLMTIMIWLPWRIRQKKTGLPKPGYVISAVVLTAVLFGLGHLPAAMAMGIKLTTPVIMYIVIGNALPGIFLGVLYWRKGIEAAMIAHALGQVIATFAAGAWYG